jgi:hypothetical protein
LRPALKPPMKTAWMGTTQIETAVRGMVSSNSNFVFLGAFPPINTSQLVPNLKEAWRKRRNLPHGKHGVFYKRYGVVWNTDDRPGRGTHWVSALFFPFEKRFEYFDSFGNAPNAAVKAQIVNVKRELAALAKFPVANWQETKVNVQVHQKEGNQCGMYAIWFFAERIMHKRTLAQLHAEVTPDDDVCELRSTYFRAEHPLLVKYDQENVKVGSKNPVLQKGKHKGADLLVLD